MATPPDFTTGQVLTAAQMNAVGMWLIKEQTIGSAVSSVTVSNCFSADYITYLVTISGGSGSTSAVLRTRIGAATTNYYGLLIYGSIAGGAVSAIAENALGNAYFSHCGFMSTAGLQYRSEIHNPFESQETVVYGFYQPLLVADNVGYYTGFLNNNTSYTDLTISTSTGTMTAGVIRIYGYRN